MENLNLAAVKIGQIWNLPTGTSETYQFQSEVEFEPNDSIKLLSPLNLEFQLVRIDQGVACQISSMSTEVELICSKCLGPVKASINASDLTRYYLAYSPLEQTDLEDNYLVEMKDLTINLLGFIREEIILQFPLIPVCSTHCKGLCSVCGVDLNHQKHRSDCQGQTEISTDDSSYRPFANLKDIIK